MPGNEQKIITIDQITGNFYGGFPFIANWNFNDGSTPSTLTISVVNSTGSYSIQDSDLNYETIVAVTLGSFVFNGYLIRYDIEESAQQSILTLEYIDQSVNLERWSVGLNNRHGKLATQSDGISTTEDKPDNMILVGREYNPCDDNLDSSSTFAAATQGKPDPCDPCPHMPADGYKNSCAQEILQLKILPVYYTFNELLTAIGSASIGFNITNPTTTGAITNHRAQHTGSLKSVLSTWCSELGLSYYFDPVAQALTFIDRSKPLKIPHKDTLKSTTNVVSLKYGATKANTFSRGFIGYVGTQGEIKEYECHREDTATLFALTPADLFTEDTGYGSSEASISSLDPKNTNIYNKGYQYYPPNNYTTTATRAVDDATALYYSTALAYYPSQVRLSYLWFEVLGIYDYSIAESWKVPYTAPNGQPSAPNTNSTISQGSTIYELGNMNIVDVISKQNSATSAMFDALVTNGAGGFGPVVPDSYLSYVQAEDLANGNGPDNPSYYFILAQCNTELMGRQEERDTMRAKQFLGRYYYRNFDKIAVGGGDNSNSQINIDAAGASATFHPRGEYIQQLPIFNFGHSAKSRIGQLISRSNGGLVADAADNLATIGTPNIQPGDTTGSKYRSLKSFILLDRADAAKFDPHETHFDDWHDTWEWYKNIVPMLIGNDGRPDILTKVLDPGRSGADTSLKLFLVRMVKNTVYKITATDGQPNPWESKSPKIRHRSYEGLNQNDTNGTEEYGADGLSTTDDSLGGQYGLMSANTVKIDMPAGLTIYPPAQSMILNSAGSASTPGGFRVFIKSASKYQKVIPKFQKIAYKTADEVTKVSKVDYVYKELSSENLEVLAGQKECLPTNTEVTSYVSKFAPYMATKNIDVANHANLKLLGVMPEQFKVEEGLSSVQITVGDNGVYTDYTFEDKVVIPPSEDIIADQVIRQNKVAPVLGESLQKMNQQQFSSLQKTVSNSEWQSFQSSNIKIT